MDKKQQKQRAQEAKLLTESRAFQESFDAVKEVYINKMLATDPNDKGQRDYYHICANALEDVKNVLTLHLQNGKVIDKDLKKKAKRYK